MAIGWAGKCPKHDKIRTNDLPHKPEMLFVFWSKHSESAQVLVVTTKLSSSSPSPASSRPRPGLSIDGLLTS
jgi:hypothetical protein